MKEATLQELSNTSPIEYKQPEITEDGDVILHGSLTEGVVIRAQPGDTELSNDVLGLGEIIRREVPVLQDEGHRLYCYYNGVYHPNGENFLRQVVKGYIQARGKTKLAQVRKINEVVEAIKMDVGFLPAFPSIRYINLRNGIYDTKGDRLLPHTSRLLTTIQLPVDYEPDAHCPEWEKFLGEVFPHDTIETAYELIAWLMIPYTQIKKLILLLGGGNNGKSIYLYGIQQFLGSRNYSNIPLHDLANDKFATAGLRGKLVNICGDIEVKKLESTGKIKMLTGGDSLEVDQKYGQRFSFVPFARHIYSANELFRSSDKTDGLIQRFCILPFPNKFDNNPMVGKQLMTALSNPSELSGLFNKVVKRIPKIKKEGLTISQSMSNAIEEYLAVENGVLRYVRANIIYDPNPHRTSIFPLDEIYSHYKAWCAKKETEPVTKAIFSRDLRKHRPDWKQHRTSTNVRYYYNLSIINRTTRKSVRPKDLTQEGVITDLDTETHEYVN